MLKHTLDNPNTYKKYDKHQVFESISLLPEQISTAWPLSNSLPPFKPDIDHIVISGMGGSALSGRIVLSLSQFILKTPLEIINNYRLPTYTNSKTLVILSSYSGNTEETISCAKDALRQKAEIAIITTGGKLAELAEKYHLPLILIKSTANPSGYPRLGIGYSLGALLSIMKHARLINLSDRDLDHLYHHLRHTMKDLLPEVPLKTNSAKKLAKEFEGKIPVLIAANHLTGTTHAIKNMLNENSKTFALCFDLPELNHHLLEGLTFPKNLNQNLHFLLFGSSLYPEAIKNRFEITKNVFEKLKFPVTVIKPDSRQPLEEAIESLSFGALFSYYLSLLNQIDPGPIPWVDYFKKELLKATNRI
jgi:glucose/mannose-6-phosphate isomerase